MFGWWMASVADVQGTTTLIVSIKLTRDDWNISRNLGRSNWELGFHLN